MKKLFAAAFLAVALSMSVAGTAPLLAGCSFFGVQRPQTFDEKVVAAYKSVEGAANLVAAVNGAGKMSDADANSALDRVAQLDKGIDVAVQLRASGDFSQAETRLAAAIAALELLKSEVGAKQ